MISYRREYSRVVESCRELSRVVEKITNLPQKMENQESFQENQDLNRQASTFNDSKKNYKGQVLNGKKDGKGTEINENEKTCYTGYWQQNKYHGEGKLHYYNTNCYFNGIWDNNEKKQGQQIYPNGDQYQGDFKNNQFHGFGILHNNSLGYRYEGGFIYGKRNGLGKEIYKNMSFYEGEFLENEKHGKGKLTFNNGSYYEGNFVRGDPHGYGIHISYSFEQSKSIFYKDPNLNKQEIFLEILDAQQKKEQQELEQKIQQNKPKGANINDDEEMNEYCYEGDFVAGYKHGIGRYTYPDGSYFYCNWEFDQQIGEILFYNGQTHKWMMYEFIDRDSIKNTYIFPEKIFGKIKVTKEEQSGFPGLIEDAYNSKIEECGISGDQFEDPYFLPSEESIQLTEEELKFLNIPPLEFIRITEHPSLKNNSKPQLFFYPLKISTIRLEDLCDHQLMTCLDSLINYPYILEKVFTKKYELDMVCFFTIKLYLEGQWKEIIIDDFIPCYKSNRNPIFASCENKEYGWYAIQKAFCKQFKEYFYYSRLDYPYMAKTYLQMLSGLPCLSFKWDNNCDDFQKKSNEDSVYQIITESNSKVRICYLRERVAQQNQVPRNYAYNVIDYITLQEEIQGYAVPLEFNFLIIQTLNPDNKLTNENEGILNRNPKILQVLQPYIQQKSSLNNQGGEFEQIKYQKFDKHVGQGRFYYILGLKDFLNYFTEIHVLQGVKYPEHNQLRIYSQQEQTSLKEFRFFMTFNISYPQEILINIQQHIFNLEKNKKKLKAQKGYKNQKDYYPTRVILAHVRDTDLKAKEDKQFQINKLKKRKQLELQRLDFNQYEDQEMDMRGVDNSFEEIKKNQDQYNDGDFQNIRKRSDNSQQSDEMFKLIDEKHNLHNSQEEEQNNDTGKSKPDIQLDKNTLSLKKVLVDSVVESEEGNNQVQRRGNIINREPKNKIESIFKEKLVNKQIKQVAFQEEQRQKEQKAKKGLTLTNKFLLLKLPESVLKKSEQQQFIKEQVDQRIENIRQDEKELEELSSNIKRKRQMPYNYIYGQGQDMTQNQCKSVKLQRGKYIIMIQTEGPEISEDLSDIAKKAINRSFVLHFTASIYAQQLIKIKEINEPEHFCKNLYEQCILQAERQFSGSGAQNPYFQKNDLTDREDGCNDLIITQYFLKEEGTFLQYLKNKSADKTLKIWRHKLQFRNQNMRIITLGKQLEDQKVDVHLWPSQEQLIIIQQVGAQVYNLEGGEGICIIDELQQDQEVEQEQLKQSGLDQSEIDNNQKLKQELGIDDGRKSFSYFKQELSKLNREKLIARGLIEVEDEPSPTESQKLQQKYFKKKSILSNNSQQKKLLRPQKVNINSSKQ